jgi:hypothetical protein
MSEKVMAIHISSDSKNGYEVVELLANRVNKKNALSVIKKDDKVFLTGGFIFENNDEIKQLFDTKPIEQHYEFAKLLRSQPFAASSYDL